MLRAPSGVRGIALGRASTERPLRNHVTGNAGYGIIAAAHYRIRMARIEVYRWMPPE